MRTFYLRYRVYAIKSMIFQRNISSNLPMLLVSLFANSLYASHFLGPYLWHIMRAASMAYNEGRLYIHLYNFATSPKNIATPTVVKNDWKIIISLLLGMHSLSTFSLIHSVATKWTKVTKLFHLMDNPLRATIRYEKTQKGKQKNALFFKKRK